LVAGLLRGAAGQAGPGARLCGSVTAPGTYTVDETGGTGTSLANYDSVIGGACTAAGSVTLAYGQNKTCTITNTRKATLTVNKVWMPTTHGAIFDTSVGGTAWATG